MQCDGAVSGADGSEKEIKVLRDPNLPPNSKEKYEFATVQVPGVLPRILVLPRLEGEPGRLVLLEDIIRRFLPRLFVNYEIKCSGPYRIMRSADLEIAEDEAEDLLKEIQKQLKKRQRGDAIRLEVEKGIDEQLLRLASAPSYDRAVPEQRLCL